MFTNLHTWLCYDYNALKTSMWLCLDYQYLHSYAFTIITYSLVYYQSYGISSIIPMHFASISCKNNFAFVFLIPISEL